MANAACSIGHHSQLREKGPFCLWNRSTVFDVSLVTINGLPYVSLNEIILPDVSNVILCDKLCLERGDYMKRLVLNKNGMLLLIISMVIATLLIIGDTDDIKILLIRIIVLLLIIYMMMLMI